MVRTANKLTAMFVNRKNLKPGLYGDGAGLYLQVSKTGGKSWLHRYTLNGKAREMGLGAVSDVNLQSARIKTQQNRILLSDGIDPLENRRANRQRSKLQEAKTITFSECAEAYIEAHKAGWKNAKHIQQWQNTLKMYAYPVFGDLSVSLVDTTLVLKVLEPIWYDKTETASRVRGRIENILDWAKVREYREGENPARWRGHLNMLLPAPSKIMDVRHHPSLDYREVPEFMNKLRQRKGVAARAFEFAILTNTRTSETLKAKWMELDYKDNTWLIPAERMKNGKLFRVPLSPRAVCILAEMHELKDSEYIFPGQKNGQPLSAIEQELEKLGIKQGEVTVHGFRSSFRDWASETTYHSSEVKELAMSHTISNKAEAAYRRGDLFEKRRKLMDDWAAYCTQPNNQSEKVVALRQAGNNA